MATGSMPWPYRTAGILPSCRSRLAGRLPMGRPVSATRVTSWGMTARSYDIELRGTAQCSRLGPWPPRWGSDARDRLAVLRHLDHRARVGLVGLRSCRSAGQALGGHDVAARLHRL